MGTLGKSGSDNIESTPAPNVPYPNQLYNNTSLNKKNSSVNSKLAYLY
jgi:hypothetical protein